MEGMREFKVPHDIQGQFISLLNFFNMKGFIIVLAEMLRRKANKDELEEDFLRCLDEFKREHDIIVVTKEPEPT